MAIQKTEAFVLRSDPFRSSSLMVTLFTRSFGKLKGIAKGVRKEGLPCPSSYEPFTFIEAVFYEKVRSDLHLISEVSILDSYEPLRTKLETIAMAYYLSELVGELTEFHDPHETIFKLLKMAFESLHLPHLNLLRRWFEIRLLSEVGLLPNLQGCLGCGSKGDAAVYFSTRQGGLFCDACRKRAPEAFPIRIETIQALTLLADSKASRFDRLVGNEVIFGNQSDGPSIPRVQQMAWEAAGKLVERFLIERLNKRLASSRFLDQVASLRGHPMRSRSRKEDLVGKAQDS